MTAEIALQRNDCGRAAANYTIAAQRLADAKLAERAADVALDCGQFQAAERAAARWRALMPDEPAALRAAMRAELGLYKIDDARGAFEAWLKSGGLAPTSSTQQRDQRRAARRSQRRRRRREQCTQIAQESGVPATLAMLRGVQARATAERPGAARAGRPGARWLELPRSGDTAQHALSAGAEAAPAQLVLARAHAGLGEADQAVAAASGGTRRRRPRSRVLPPSMCCMLLGRDREARTALETLRDTAALAHAGAAAPGPAGLQSRRLRGSAARFLRAAQ